MPKTFFAQHSKGSDTQQQPGVKKRTLVNLGGVGDCGFRAVAAGLIDNVCTHPHFDAGKLKPVIHEYARLFPFNSTNQLETPVETFKRLMKETKPNLATFVRQLGFVLRQLTVNELVANPARYPGVFSEVNEGTSPAVMREITTEIDESSLAALARALQMPLDVQVVAPHKPLPMTHHYEKAQENVLSSPPLVVQLCDRHYQAQVLSPERFQLLKYVAADSPIKTDEKGVYDDPDMSDVMAQVAASEQQIVASYESTKECLHTMLACNEINCDQLLAAYVQNMPTSDYLQGRVAHVNLEYGNTAFFDALNSKKSGGSFTSSMQMESQELEHELIHALSRALSIGQMNEEAVFEMLEHKTSQRLLAP